MQQSNKGKLPLYINAFTLDPADTMEDIWIPSIRDLTLEPLSKKQLGFTVHIGKLDEFSYKNELNMVARTIGVNLEYSYPEGQVDKLNKQFELYIRRSIKVVERGIFDREIEL